MKKIEKLKDIEKFTFRHVNPDWPTNVDFVPVLSLQAQLDSKQEIYFMKAHVSETAPGRKIIDTGIISDLKFKVKSTASERFEIAWGSPDPKA